MVRQTPMVTHVCGTPQTPGAAHQLSVMLTLMRSRCVVPVVAVLGLLVALTTPAPLGAQPQYAKT